MNGTEVERSSQKIESRIPNVPRPRGLNAPRPRGASPPRLGVDDPILFGVRDPGLLARRAFESSRVKAGGKGSRVMNQSVLAFVAQISTTISLAGDASVVAS